MQDSIVLLLNNVHLTGGIIISSVVLFLLGYYRIGFVYAGFLLQTIYLLSRGIHLGRLPIVGPHDTLFFLSASIVLFAIPLTIKIRNRQQFLYPLLVLSIVFMLLSLLYKPHNVPLTPLLKTFWFEAHIVSSFFSYALFSIAAVLGVVFFIRKGEQIEILQYKIILTGYCLFSAGIIFGGIWAYFAWGTYWLWTPKELWTVILWLFYSLYLHARLRKWWTGKPSVTLGIIGFFIMMFTYLGVSLLMESSHAF
jgi:ABC-type transport system involved in cytochrome c biogenesis permease subunit